MERSYTASIYTQPNTNKNTISLVFKISKRLNFLWITSCKPTAKCSSYANQTYGIFCYKSLLVKVLQKAQIQKWWLFMIDNYTEINRTRWLSFRLIKPIVLYTVMLVYYGVSVNQRGSNLYVPCRDYQNHLLTRIRSKQVSSLSAFYDGESVKQVSVSWWVN